MSREKLSMRKVSEVARLRSSGLSNRQIARSCNLARSTVAEYLERFEDAGLSWPLPPEMSEEELDVRLFQRSETRGRDPARPLDHVPFFDIFALAAKHGPDVGFLEIERDPELALGEFEELARHAVVEPVDPGNPVTDREDDTRRLHPDPGLVALDLPF